MTAASLIAMSALLAAVIAAGFLSLVATYSGQSCEVSPGSTVECIDDSRTLVEQNGQGAYGLLAIPVGLAAAAVAAILYRLPKGIEWSLAGLLLGACVLAVLSVGLFFLPAALLLVVAVATDRRRLAAS